MGLEPRLHQQDSKWICQIGEHKFDLDHLEIGVWRSGSLETQTESELILGGDGTVTYVGTRCAPLTGRHKWNVPQERICSLLVRFVSVKFDLLQDAYPLDGTDHPHTRIRIIANGRAKEVINVWCGEREDHPEVPDEIIAIHDLLDSLAADIEDESGLHGLWR